MIKVVYGTKGVGKTSYLIEDVHSIIDDCKGHIVFIDNSDELITALRHEIRFVNITEYPIDNLCSFYGFISGLVAANYDIMAIYVDRLDLIAEEKPDYQVFLKRLSSSTTGLIYVLSFQSAETLRIFLILLQRSMPCKIKRLPLLLSDLLL